MLYPFGHGLSYTSFVYSGLSATPAAGAAGSYIVSVTVTNAGACLGGKLVQGLICDATAFCKLAMSHWQTAHIACIAAGDWCCRALWLPSNLRTYMGAACSRAHSMQQGTQHALCIGHMNAQVA